MATLATLATLSLVLPTFTPSRPGPEFSLAQLTFAAAASLALYLIFVLTQTGRHRDFFLPVAADGTLLAEDVPASPPSNRAAEDVHVSPPSNRAALRSVALLLVALVAVVGLAKVESPSIKEGVAALGFRRLSSGS